MTTLAVSKLNEFRSELEKRRDRLAAIIDEANPTLKQGIIDRHISLALSSITNSRGSAKLLKCSPESVYLCVYQAARFKLEIGGVMGECYMVPYSGVATFQLGYPGIIKMIIRDGQVSHFNVKTVNDKDFFEHEDGTNPFIKHIPSFDSDLETAKAHYAISHFHNRQTMHKAIGHRQAMEWGERYSKSFSYNDSAWQTNPNPMCCKTAVVMLGKFLPKSVETAQALLIDHQNETGETVPVDPDYRGEAIVTPATTTADKMHDSIAPKDDRPVLEQLKAAWEMLEKDEQKTMLEHWTFDSFKTAKADPGRHEGLLFDINQLLGR